MKKYFSRNKYNAKKTEYMNIKFDSKLEANRYGELIAMQKGGLIKDLERQVRYKLEVNNQLITTYVADFVYIKINDDGSQEKIVEYAKGVETPVFKIKKKLMKAVHEIEIIISQKRY